MNLLRLNKQNPYIDKLNEIRKIIPTAIIAGGAIRDMYHDKHVHDIDIYVPCDPIKPRNKTDVYSESFWKRTFGLGATNPFNNDYIDAASPNVESYDVKNHIDMVWTISKDGILYNIIIVDIDPEKYVTRFFDIGLCKAYCDGTKIRLTSDFMHDSKHKKLTIVSEDMPQDEFNYMMNNHIRKLKSKYPDHSLVIPPHYAEHHKEYNNTVK